MVFSVKRWSEGPWALRQTRDESTLMDPGVRELVVLSSLAALGCGLAATQGDLLFVAPFGTVNLVTIIEAVRRW
jgi:hypothetical protein